MNVSIYHVELDDTYPVLVKENVKRLQEINHISANSPEKCAKLMQDVFRIHKLAEEHVYLLCFNNKHRLLGIHEISKGTVNCTLIRPREVYLAALLQGAVNIVLVHNHPSGTLEPSQEDIDLTRVMYQAGMMLGISLSDHLIVGEDYFSFRENLWDEIKAA